MAAFSEKSVPRRRNNVVTRSNIDDTVAIMRLDDDEGFYTIDGMAAEAWKLMDGKTAVASITAKLSKKHKVEAVTVAPKVRDLILQLKKEKLIDL